MSFLGKLAQARAELEAHHEDPWRNKLEAAVRNKDAISTAALLDLLRVPATTGTARRLAAVMRALHFIPIKSRVPHAGRSDRQYRYTRVGSSHPHNEIVPNDQQRNL